MTKGQASGNHDRIRVAVVGAGVGRAHVAAYGALPGMFEIVAVCDIDLIRAGILAEASLAPDAGGRDAKRRLPCVTGSFDELCRMDGLDVIDLCTPPYLHAEQALQVLSAGKYAVCEKPVAGSLAALDALAAAEIKNGRRIMPIFNYRFGDGVRKLRHLIAEGIAGPAYLGTIEVAWRRRAGYYAVPWRGHWRTDLGGSLTVHAIHFLDLLTYLLGPVRSVFARTATLVNPIETEDCAAVSFEMASGALASLTVTTGSSVEISRQRYCFANLVAESNLAPYDQNTNEPWQFVADTAELQPGLNASLTAAPSGPASFVGQFVSFGEALRAQSRLPVTLADARRATELLTAIYASARSHTPEFLPISPEHPLYRGWLPSHDHT